MKWTKVNLFDLMQICREVFGNRILNTSFGYPVTYAAIEDIERDNLEDICVVKIYVWNNRYINVCFLDGESNKERFIELFTAGAKRAGYVIQEIPDMVSKTAFIVTEKL